MLRAYSALNGADDASVLEFDGLALTGAKARDAFDALFASFVAADAPDLGFALSQPVTASVGADPNLVVTTALDVVDATDGLISLREAIDSAEANALAGSGGTTVSFDPTVFAAEDTAIEFASGASQIVIVESITIDGDADGDGDGDVTVDANGEDGVFTIDSAAGDATVTIDALTITGGLATAADADGGGVFVGNGDTLVLSNGLVTANAVTGATDLTNNIFSSGGGLATDGGSILIQDSVISNNSAPFGGGAYAINGELNIESSTIVGNTSTDGCAGGVLIALSTVVISISLVTSNTAD
ncbi:MAG: hypothetical protein ACFB2Z_06135 [Maricaulaceae bacterium]